jgi:hypothetical protein
VEGFHAAKLVYSASTVIVAYDLLLTIDREVRALLYCSFMRMKGSARVQIEYFWGTDVNLLTKFLYYLVSCHYRWEFSPRLNANFAL